MNIPASDQFLVNLVLQRTRQFIAMGFHFPASEYSGFMRDNAVRGAVAIYDDRESGSRKIIHA